VPLWSNLGSLTFKISTRNAMTQRYFDQGLYQSALILMH
jgi:hypothetical protein